MGKLKFAFYWAASCGGCEIAVLDINEKILDVLAAAVIGIGFAVLLVAWWSS
jgi:F420-non-reducing hydrogenase small subunit